jgi:hypothetical protein
VGILETLKAVQQDRAATEILERSQQANAFLSVARSLMAARALGMSPAQYAESARLSPAVIEVLKVGPAAMSTGSAAALFQPMVAGFLASLRSASVFDRMWPHMVHCPLHSLAIAIQTAFTVGAVGESLPKPATSLALTANTLTPQKCAGFVVGTNELFRLATAASVTLFNDALRQATVIACNTKMLADLIGQTTPIAASGTDVDAILADLKALLDQIEIGENSRLFFVISGDHAKALATYPVQFPKFSLAGGGEVLAGVPTIISDALPDAGTTALIVDASALLAGDDGIALDASRQTMLQMESAPQPEGASTILLSLFQTDSMALRCERSFAYGVGRANAVASLSGVDYT